MRDGAYGKFSVSSYLAIKVFYVKWALGPIFRLFKTKKNVGSRSTGLDKEAKIFELLEPTVTALDCQLWGIEYSAQAKHATLRIFIDKKGGVDIEDCERVSRQVSGILDVEDPVGTAYTLEVSSPGMDRRLFRLEQFKEYVGSLVKIRLRSNYEGRRNFKGRLAGVENDEIVIQQDNEEYLFPFELLDKAQIVPEFK